MDYNLAVCTRIEYRVTLHPSDEGYSVSVPGLPGCWSQGATEEEALANIEDAIREYLEVMAEDLTAFQERAGEPLLDFEEVVQDLKWRGRI